MMFFICIKDEQTHALHLFYCGSLLLEKKNVIIRVYNIRILSPGW